MSIAPEASPVVNLPRATLSCFTKAMCRFRTPEGSGAVVLVRVRRYMRKWGSPERVRTPENWTCRTACKSTAYERLNFAWEAFEMLWPNLRWKLAHQKLAARKNYMTNPNLRRLQCTTRTSPHRYFGKVVLAGSGASKFDMSSHILDGAYPWAVPSDLRPFPEALG